MTSSTGLAPAHAECESHRCVLPKELVTSVRTSPAHGWTGAGLTAERRETTAPVGKGQPRTFVQSPLVSVVDECTASRHGTRAAYVAGCRCPEAREANRRYAHERKHRTARAEFGAADPYTVPAARAVEEIARLRRNGWSLRRIEAATRIGRDHIQRILGRTSRPLKRVRWATYIALRDLADAPPLAGGQLVDATGTWRRLHALIALGYPQTWLARELGLGRALQLNRERVTVRNAEKVAALYDRLSMTPGPSERTRVMAWRKGYLPPLAWDDEDLDDPDAWPGLRAQADDADEVTVERFVKWALLQPTRTQALREPRPVDLNDAERVEVTRRLLDAGITQSAVGVLLGRNGPYLRELVERAAS